jgi:alkylation response protein AidB-like acyl-CoA dehydrogenase
MSKNLSFFWNAPVPLAGSFPEEYSDEQRMIATLTADFVGNEILPLSQDLDEAKPGLMQELMRKAGELGLLAPDVPEDWGGMGLDLASSLLITENMGPAASFAVSHSDHTALGTLPIVLFGSDAQKAKYLPRLASGESIAAYALTEGGSGSDALAARTKARLSDDGSHYLLNGAKQFITNAGIADVFVAYANVDDKLTAFLVDKDVPGLSLGAEEHKMGISGSSTRSVVFEDAQVPAENLLYEVGRGHVVAFNVLNVGRLKLAAQCVGAAKAALGHASKYAQEREQFGKPIARYGLIQDKLARMASAIYVAESLVSRAAAKLGNAMAKADGAAAVAQAVACHAAECSLNKVFASEVLGFVADETVQVFGGYGYSAEYPVEKIYRDARINRIFAGTSEINRLLVADALLAEAKEASPAAAGASSEPLAKEGRAVAAGKAALLSVAKAAIAKYGDGLREEQEILALIADAATDLYATESGLLRAERAAAAKDYETAALRIDLAKSFCSEVIPRVRIRCVEVLAFVADPADLATGLRELDVFFAEAPANGIALKRGVASRVIDAGGYPLN